jgi:thioester reductase-like protein
VVLPYERLRPDNVIATTEVLRFAARRRTKATHVISTLGTFFGSAYAGTVVTEADEPASPDGMSSPFAQSKWVGDALARAARRRGLPVSIYRPARVTGDSRTGESKPDDVLARMLATFVQLGCAPDRGEPYDMAPADFLATAIGHLSRLPQHAGRDFHLRDAAGLPGGELGAGLRALGLPVAAVSRDEWLRRLEEATEAGQDLPLNAFSGYSMPAVLPTFDCTATDATLAGIGLSHPGADATLLRTYLDYMVHSGLLPIPAGR